jgi:glycosyltransferase involved in cell wall biosynthesis
MDKALPLVSVIIPAHNEAICIANAIESALFQKTTFNFEIIIIDDGSSDDTLIVARSYTENFPNVRVIFNKTCLGKGQSVRKAYNSAKGKYVHILDADDLFTNWEKLQYQVEILENGDEFFAVSHNTLCVTGDGTVHITPEISQDRTFDYLECCAPVFYCHTSSCLFRRIEGGLPSYFSRDTMRGDSAFLFYHAFHWKKSLYVMRKVMSIYSITGNGIWTSLNDKSKNDLNNRLLLDLQTLVVKDKQAPEYLLLEKKRKQQKSLSKQPQKSKSKEEQQTLDTVIARCEHAAATVFRKDIQKQAFQAMYSLPVVDSLIETVGRAIGMVRSMKLVGRTYHEKKAIFLVSGFVPNGGGVFREISEIISELLRKNFEVVIVSTGKIETASSIIDDHFNHASIRYIKADTSLAKHELVDALQLVLMTEAADRIYPFLTHHDVVGFAALQRGFARQIVFDFVYDHGLSLGIHHSAIDTIVTKNNSQASALAPTVRPEKLVLLEPFFTDRAKCNRYVPRKNRQFTTATAAAREYKIATEYKYSYFKVVALILQKLDAQHIHFGPLSEDAKTGLLVELGKVGVDQDRFIHIPWADDFGDSLIEMGVDVFIAPFPICSARLAIEVMSCGIPSLNHKAENPTLPEAGDFVEPGQPSWDRPDALVKSLLKMDEDILRDLSSAARQFFCEHNTSDISLDRFSAGTFDTPAIKNDHPFQMSDLAAALFYDYDMDDVLGRSRTKSSKFWHRGALRRKLRAEFHRFGSRRKA